MSPLLRTAIAVVAVFIAIQVTASFITESNSCRRVQDVRTQSNARTHAIIGILNGSAQARDNLAASPDEPPSQVATDRALAARYRALITTIRPVKNLDCGLPWPETP